MNRETPSSEQRRHYLNKGFLIADATIAILIALYFVWMDFKPEIILLLHYSPHNRATLLRLIRSHGLTDMALLTIIIALMNAIPGISNSVICIFAGLCYGPFLGLLVNWVGNILGNFMVAALIRKLHFSKHFRRRPLLNELMSFKYPSIGLTLGYMIPIIPSVLVNYAVVQMKISRVQFILMVIVGMLPTSFLYAFGGDAIFKGDLKRIIAAVVAILLILILFTLIHHRQDAQAVE